MRAGPLSRLGVMLLACFLVGAPARAAQWFALGPYGGDARSFAVDPHDSRHLYLGTETGWLYQSHDGGTSWKRIAQVDGRSDLVIQHIVMDPASPERIIVGAYTLNHSGGGVFISDDAGKHWTSQAEMSGQSVRSVARSQSDPNLLVAGTLEGIFRSKDDGKHWERISPQSSTEIHEVESIAIDPKDPNIIYAGTWHLPWKTTDGGAHWDNIKEGIIDDSDVFSIVIDPTQPNIVYASACSGIYKSMDSGGQFKGGVSINKGQGIPSSARRTRKLKLDPTQSNTLYAGTTEGLFKSTDAGSTWVRVTRDDVTINDVYVDPNQPQHVLLATDRGGVLRSEDGGLTFESSNTGFSLRQVVAYAADPRNPAQLYVGVVNDKETGGVFSSADGGVRWRQMSDGLAGRDVLSLTVTPDETLLAGTSHGIFRMENGMWNPSTSAASAHAAGGAKKPGATAAARKGVKGVRAVAKPAQATPSAAHRREVPTPALAGAAIYALTSGSGAVYAGTSAGLWRSQDSGASWTQLRAPQLTDGRYVVAHGQMIVAGSLTGLAVSENGGDSWTGLMPPPTLTQIGALAIDGTGDLWIGGPEGVFYSADHGASWKTLHNLFVRQVDGIYYDAANKRVLVSSSSSTVGFAASVPDFKVTYWDTGWTLRFLRPVGDHLVGATLFDGMVVEPKMVDSPFAGQTRASVR